MLYKAHLVNHSVLQNTLNERIFCKYISVKLFHEAKHVSYCVLSTPFRAPSQMFPYQASPLLTTVYYKPSSGVTIMPD